MSFTITAAGTLCWDGACPISIWSLPAAHCGFRALLRNARPVLLNPGAPGSFDITPWADRVQLIEAGYTGAWELPALGAVTAPAAVLIRPDGYVAWVGGTMRQGLADALTTWFGPPAVA